MSKRKHNSALNEGGRCGSPNPPKKKYRKQPFGFHKLKEIANESPEEAVIKCCDEMFFELLADADKGRDWVDLELKAIATALTVNDTMKSYRDELRTKLLYNKPEFLKETCVKRLNDELVTDQEKPRQELLNSLDQFLEIYNTLQRMDPSTRKILSSSLKIVKGTFPSKSNHYADVQSKYDLVIQDVHQCQKLELEQSGQKVQVVRQGRVCVKERPSEDFRSISVAPTLKDLDPVFIVRLRKNKAKGGYKDQDDYLDTQFRLLREDFISTVREGVRDVKKNLHKAKSGKFRGDNCRVYTEFEIKGEELTWDGRFCVVRLPVHQPAFKNSRWLKSRRLIYGSLLCLSTGNFTASTTVFATVAQREEKRQFDQSKQFSRPHSNNNQSQNQRSSYQRSNQFPGSLHEETIKIKILPESQAIYNSLDNKRGPFIVIESTSYYESYQHVLRGLQNFDPGTLPFQNYIVSCSTEVASPMYLEPGIAYKLPITEGNYTSPAPLQDFDEWPTAEEMEFNQSQYEAYKTALTKEFVVIQGPPGTGKTYVGLRIMQTFLENLFDKMPSRRLPMLQNGFMEDIEMSDEEENILPKQLETPILVVCYTNHALDQFLEGILKFHHSHNMIRVGSRSRSEKLQEYNLSVKKKHHGSFRWTLKLKEVYSKKNRLQTNYKSLDEEYKSLQRHKLITDLDLLIPSEESIFIQQLEEFHNRSQHGYDPAISLWLRIYRSEGDRQLQEFQKECQQPKPVAKHSQRENPYSQSYEYNHRATQESFLEDGEIDPEEERRLIDGFDNNSKDADESTVIVTAANPPRKDEKAMTKEEVSSLLEACSKRKTDIFSGLSLVRRWKLYRYWYELYCKEVYNNLNKCLQEYESSLANERDIKNQQDLELLRSAKVIGMTTTGAAKMQSVLQQVGPEIVVVEEAAEVLEAHIITALSKHCKHLILIGDHKQLKPSPTVYDLAKQYHLDLSLFERMVNNGLPVKTLNIQHRMRPEVSKYMRHIYDRLDDHPSVENRDHIRGMAKSVFFFNHQNPEEEEQGLMSKFNTFEADMVVALARHLLRQNYLDSQITVITMYKGQEFQIRQRIRSTELASVKVTSVDNFQGEENDIIILSLVRSNKEGKSGFVKIENRVCVSLSRAKLGMYVFGNFDMICKDSELWQNIIKDAKAYGEFGEEFDISCDMHSELILVKTVDDFIRKAPLGGCTKPCDAALPNCLHKCPRSCHKTDSSHLEYKCPEKCQRGCKAGLHPCKGKCGDIPCPPCNIFRTVQLECSHDCTAPCSKLAEPESIKCDKPCLKVILCGHHCSNRCSDSCTKECSQPVERTCSECGEIQIVPCHISTKPELFECSTPCTEILDCGHNCRGTCSSCKVNKSHSSPEECPEPCRVQLECGHTCSGVCGKCHTGSHPPCKRECTKQLNCGHQCTGVCFQCAKSNHCNCKKDCEKTLDCGHRCGGTCERCKKEGSHRRCKEKCSLRCHHNKTCKSECYHPCQYSCKASCTWHCSTCGTCRRDCGKPCKSIDCSCQCKKNKISCKMCKKVVPCRGMKGEPCPELCVSCANRSIRANRNLLPEELSGKLFSRWLKLTDCNHILPVAFMEKVANSSQYGRVTCPYTNCGKPVVSTHRLVSIAWKVRYNKSRSNRGHSDSKKKDSHRTSRKRAAVIDRPQASNSKRVKPAFSASKINYP